MKKMRRYPLDIYNKNDFNYIRNVINAVCLTDTIELTYLCKKHPHSNFLRQLFYILDNRHKHNKIRTSASK
jgi:hypothetical protein